nr:HNH/ENDO VII family nuclease [Pseudomonas gingeri]
MVWTDGSRRTVERYNGSNGKLLSVTDANGTSISYGYDANGRLNSVKDSGGQELVLVYNASGKLERLDTRSNLGLLNRQVYYGYDNLGRLTSVSTDLSPDDNSIADGNVYTTQYSYFGDTFYIAGVTQSDGTAVSFSYEKVGADYRVSTVTDASGITRFSYDAANQRTDVLNGLGQQWSYFYNTQGQLIEVQTPAVGGQRLSTRYAYDTDGNVIQVTNGRGLSVTYQYDANGNRVLERDSQGNTITRTYNADNQLLNEVHYSVAAVWNSTTGTWTEPPASSAQVTRSTYDSSDRLRFRIDGRGQVTEYRYNTNGLPSQEIIYGDALFNLNGLAINDSVSEVDLTAWAAARDKTRSSLTELSYDLRGNLSRRVVYGAVDATGAGILDSVAGVTEFVYDNYGQLLQTLAVRGTGRDQKTVLSSTAYDGLGRVISQIDAAGTRITAYNGTNRTVSVTNSAGLTVTQAYDGLGRLVAFTQTAANAVPRVTLYVYDAAGRQSMVQDPTGVRSYTLYDEAGRLIAQVDGTGAVTEYRYNKAGQRNQETRYATLVDTSTWYDGMSVTKTLVSDIRPPVTAADRITTQTYDAANRLASNINAVGSVTTYTYDGLGQLVQQQSGDRTTRFFYDASGHQTGQLDAEGYLRENLYDASGRLVQTLRYADATPTASRASGGLNDLRPLTDSGNLSTWYYYDAAGRQIGSVDDKQFVSEIVYDEAANTQVTLRYALTYIAAITAGTVFSTIKAAVAGGAKQTTTTAFDAQGRVGQRTTTDGTITTYEYDTAGRLVRETHAQGSTEERSTRTLYDAFGQTIGKLLGEASARITAGMSDTDVAVVYAQYGLTYRYDAAGRVASATDALGNRTLSYYDADGRLTHLVNALGEVSETRYTAFGEISEQTRLTNRLAAADLAGLSGGLLTLPVSTLVQAIRNANTDNRTQATYNLLGLKETSVDALGNQIRYTYNAFGEQVANLRSGIDGTSLSESLSYNRRGELIGRVEDVDGLSRSTSTAYDAFGRVIRRIDGRGQLSTISYNDSGRTIVASNPLNQSQTSEYDAFDRLLRQTDALGQVTAYRYDDVNRTLTVTTPDKVSVSTVKNRHGQTLSVTDGAGNTSTYSYDKDGQLLTSSDGLGRITRNAYDVAGHLLSVTDALGRVTRYGYDAANRTVTRTDANNGVTRYTFDGQGRKVREVQGEGQAGQRITDYGYDRNGQILTVLQDPEGLKLLTTYIYDGFGRQVQVARGTPTSPNQQVILYVFDNLGRRTAERVDPNGLNLTTQYRYNVNDQVRHKIDPAGNSTWYVYDSIGQLTDTVDALGGVTRNTYDGAGNLTSTTRFATALSAATLATFGDKPTNISPTVNAAKDQSTFFLYDERGRHKATINALNQVSVVVYDANGRVIRTLQFDRPIPVNTPRTIDDTFAALIAAVAQPHVTASTYDAAGQLSSVTDAAGKTESYSYDAAGNRSTLTNKNGAVWNYRYDSLNRLVEEISPAVNVSSIAVNGTVTSQSVLQVTRITYDAVGNITSRTAGRLRNSLAADPALDDLSQARTTGYAYDAVGHQVQITSPGWYNKATGAYQQVSDGTANTFQITTDVTYDVLGNAVRNRVRVNNTGVAATDFVDSYKIYDSLGQLTHDIDPLKGVTAYTYDAQGNRLTTKRYANALAVAVPATGYFQTTDINATVLVASPGQDRTITTGYDVLGRKIFVQQDLVSLYTFNGSVAGASLITAAPTTLYSYNALGQLVRETQVARNASGVTVMTGASTVYYYDQVGNRVGSVDALGNYTRMEYDAQGKLTRQVEYANALSSWDETTQPANPLASANDRSTRYDYDAMGRLLQVTQEGVRYWQQSVNAQNGVVSASAIVGNVVISQVTYDGVGNTRTVTDAAGNITTTDYNALGQVSKVTEPARISARAGAADPFAAGVIVASPITTYAVNAFGQVISETHSAGQDANNVQQAGLTQVTRTRYDAAGYEVQGIDAVGVATNYKVDIAGRRTEQSLQTSVVLSGWTVAGASLSRTQTIRRTFVYDALGQQLSTTDWYIAVDSTPKSTSSAAVYNRFGEVTTQLLNGYLQASYLYDQVGHATQQQNGQGITQVDYDLTGKASRSNQIGDASTAADDRITYTRYDILGRALEQDLPAFEANLNSDTLNNINLTLSTPIIRQTYDRWGNVLSRTDARGYVTSYTYDRNNKQLTETLPVTDILRENGTSYRASLIHEKRYDALGQLIQETDLVGPYAGMATSTELRTRQHVYNQGGELIKDIDALGYARSYLTDSNGNRVATKDALGTVLVDSYDAMDRQLTHGIIRNGVAVTLLTNQYDQAGRLVGEISGSTAVEETLASASGSGVTTGVAGNVRYTLFDERGNIVKTRNESKVEKSFEYNAANLKVTEIDGLNNTLTWTYDKENYGRMISHKNLSNYTLNYSYNAFGQVTKELATGLYTPPNTIFTISYPGALRTKTNNARLYTYYANGLVKTVSDVDTEAVESRNYIETSTHEYDLGGNKTRSIDARTFNKFSTGIETRYRVDERSRLKETKSPIGTTTTFWPTQNTILPKTALLESLRYDFDELGNRRRSYMDSTDQSGVRTVLDHWYKFDQEDRVLVNEGFLSNGQVVAGKQAGKAKGDFLTYDATGRRLASEQWSSTNGNSELYSRSEYAYNDLSQVVSSSNRKLTRQLGADTASTVLGQEGPVLGSANTYDFRGNQTLQTIYTSGEASAVTSYAYRGDGQTTLQLSYKVSSGTQKLQQATYLGEVGMIDAVGNQVGYRYAAYNSDGTSVAYTGHSEKYYQGFDTYKEYHVTNTWNGGTPAYTQFAYASNGILEQVFITYKGARIVQSNRDGQILASNETLNKTTQSYFSYNGKVLANAGTSNAPDISDTFTPISSDYPGRTPTSYIVNQGDTFASIAQAVWGDSGMWYLIADANVQDPSKPLVSGNTLRIPNVVSSTHNNESTFKPYSSEDVIGDTTPQAKLPPPPSPPKPKGKKCGGVASIVMVVVAIVATVYTAGAAGAALGAASSATATTASAIAASAGGYGALGVSVLAGSAAISTGALIGGAVIGGLVGAAASQMAGKAMGVVDSFSWGQVAVGGLTAGITAGFGYLAQAGQLGAWGKSAAIAMKDGGSYGSGYAALGTFNYANNQIASRIVGLDTSFSWRNVAASAAGATIAGSIGGGNSLPASVIRGQVGAYASAVIKDKWLGGGRPDYGQVAADAFGNVLADYMIHQISASSSQETTTGIDYKKDLLLADIDADKYLGRMSTDRPPLQLGPTNITVNERGEPVEPPASHIRTSGEDDWLSTFADIGESFLEGGLDALKFLGREVLDTPLRVRDMGVALSAVAVNTFRDEGNYWLPQTISGMARDYETSGQTWDEFSLHHNPIYALGVDLPTALGESLGAAVTDSDYRPLASLAGELVSGAVMGKVGSKIGNYGVTIGDIGFQGPGRSQAGAIYLEFGEFPKAGTAEMSTAEAMENPSLSSASTAQLWKTFSDNTFFTLRTEWSATRPAGTQQTYSIIQRNDIDWTAIRQNGPKDFIGKTNADAAERGFSPQLADGSFATLHHVGQDARGALAEASTRYHGVGTPGQNALHSQYGKSVPNPYYPIDRRAFSVDTREYWQWRVKNQ